MQSIALAPVDVVTVTRRERAGPHPSRVLEPAADRAAAPRAGRAGGPHVRLRAGHPLFQAYRHGHWEPDPPILDDQALVANVRGRGLVLLTGCGHSGSSFTA